MLVWILRIGGAISVYATEAAAKDAQKKHVIDRWHWVFPTRDIDDYTHDVARLHFNVYCSPTDRVYVHAYPVAGLTHTLLREALDECVTDMLKEIDKVGGPAD